MNQEKIITDDLDKKLFKLYENAEIPEHVNISLKNKIAYEAAYGKQKIELWWLPALLNTVTVLLGIVFSFIAYLITRVGGSYTFIPNIINVTSVLTLKIILISAFIDLIVSWLATAIMIPAASGIHYLKGLKMF